MSRSGMCSHIKLYGSTIDDGTCQGPLEGCCFMWGEIIHDPDRPNYPSVLFLCWLEVKFLQRHVFLSMSDWLPRFEILVFGAKKNVAFSLKLVDFIHFGELPTMQQLSLFIMIIINPARPLYTITSFLPQFSSRNWVPPTHLLSGHPSHFPKVDTTSPTSIPIASDLTAKRPSAVAQLPRHQAQVNSPDDTEYTTNQQSLICWDDSKIQD
ncbi:unnamed protein product [Aspergillus oryzae]|uniref:Unnamed protein product n=3 Tax=Aspergillus oryzae TaxID=5062 RepID=A0AAN5C2A1_ASPOZ|nr:unnamed protein product [Aspergillus oryzae]GMF91278.1 unnamed protein product [Aspergillus oryzae]GMG15831.1 unnamed protein product [Aspergillus oryzae]GMG36782.1 unnamed protein product [Aspergillus oryzae]GMG49145.1 unnamed protein product [Aspergillus oryzae var. brunneus]